MLRNSYTRMYNERTRLFVQWIREWGTPTNEINKERACEISNGMSLLYNQ